MRQLCREEAGFGLDWRAGLLAVCPLQERGLPAALFLRCFRFGKLRCMYQAAPNFVSYIHAYITIAPVREAPPPLSLHQNSPVLSCTRYMIHDHRHST